MLIEFGCLSHAVSQVSCITTFQHEKCLVQDSLIVGHKRAVSFANSEEKVYVFHVGTLSRSTDLI